MMVVRGEKRLKRRILWGIYKEKLLKLLRKLVGRKEGEKNQKSKNNFKQ
jgi:hypothetical protein